MKMWLVAVRESVATLLAEKAIGFSEAHIAPLRDLVTKTRAESKGSTAPAGPGRVQAFVATLMRRGPARVEQSAEMAAPVNLVLYEIQVGDEVVVLDRDNARYVIGTVTSDYETEATRIAHRRNVDWTREVDVAAVPARLRADLDGDRRTTAVASRIGDEEASWIRGAAFAIEGDRRHNDFETVRKRERLVIERKGRDPDLGIAISGGGIRSASFALGALQSLANTALLEKAGYLSSVSGGGFAAAALVAQGQAGRSIFTPPTESSLTRGAENAVIRHIRRNASYLAPGGILSLDGAVLAVTYLFGFAINFAQIAFAFATLVTGAFALHEAAKSNADYADYARYLWLGLAGTAAVTIAVLFSPFTYPRRTSPLNGDEDRRLERRRFRRQCLTWVSMLLALGSCAYFMGDFMDALDGAFCSKGIVVRAVAVFATHVSIALGAAGALSRGLSRRVSLSLAAQILGLALVGTGFVVVVLVDYSVLNSPTLVKAGWSLICEGEIYVWFTAAFCAYLIGRAFPELGSVHHFYRDKITETFITDVVSEKDNVDPPAPLPGLRLRNLGDPAAIPLPIVNATVNLPASVTRRGSRLRMDLFELTPIYVGSPATGFALTREWGGGNFSLCRAIAASGAAVSPQMGRYTQPLLSFLISLFNLRLGVFVRNPADAATWNVPYRAAPLGDLGIWNLSERSSTAYLSDGGHIENLGLLPLLRRRCRFIVVIDAEEDAVRAYEGLAIAQRIARTEVNAAIDIDLSDLDLKAGGRAGAPCAVGKIRYPGGEAGVLVYIKAGVVGTETVDVRNYARTHRSFPNDSTGNQFFDDSQFEAYRELGRQAVEAALRPVVLDESRSNAPDTGDTMRMARADLGKAPARLFEELYCSWRVRPNVPLDAFLRTTDTFMGIENLLATSGGGNGYRDALCKVDGVAAKDVHVYLMQIQLMEQVYLACKLEQYHDHPENAGWLTLFKVYAKNDDFKLVWAETSSIFGENFRTFARRELDLPAPPDEGASRRAPT